MKRKNLRLRVLGCIVLVFTPFNVLRSADGSPAARTTVSTATVSGRVQNVVTGQYLNNARVVVKGTDLVAFTDQSGTYRLVEVPGGSVVLEVFYTGLDPQQVQLEVTPGGSIEHDIDLTSVARYGQNTNVVKLDPFAVSSSKETDIAAIAINEQRFAPNIKNVTATDAYGDVMGGNVGEFLKLLPGVFWADTGQPDVQEVSVRGFAAQMTSFSVDGAQLASSPTTSTQRAFQVRQVAINSLSRVEVTKVPTPSSRADSMAGSVNMVSKSAFERSQAQLRYSVSCLHALCNAHHLRELTRAWEDDGQHWAEKMHALLLEIKDATTKAGGRVTEREAKSFRSRYRNILTRGDRECPPPEPKDRPARPGRMARTKSRNLLERLRNFETETLRFMTDKLVPFTNNQGENDERMTKVQQKISGCFRSFQGAQIFCRVRSYLSTCRKHGLAATEALTMLFSGHLPDFIPKPR
ncbi:MAG: transposase, partial [Verrucomicrobia bacterium]|nr:transposase [Verrucomicrobiota bacterium]